MHEKFQTRISYEIMRYFVQNPDAADTLEGIIDWWLIEQKIKYELNIVVDSLKELVDRGYVIPVRASNKIYYRINKNKYDEIKEIVNEHFTSDEN